MQMEQELKPTVLEIPTEKVAWLKHDLEKKVFKRAAKLGLVAPAVTYSAPAIIKRKSELTGKVTEVSVTTVTIEPGVVKLPGFQFLGTVEYSEAGNLLYPVPGATLDEKFRTADCHCDHCHKVRDRKSLYLFSEVASGSQIQVGKTCLRDFMGVDPATVAFYSTLDRDLKDSEEESWGGGGSGYYVDLGSFTATVAAVIEHEGGYVSNATAQAHEVQSTSHLASVVLWPNRKSDTQLAYSQAVKRKITQETVDKALEAIRWIRDEWKDSSDYAWNLKVIAKAGAMLSGKQFGMGASLWPTYVRQMGWLKEKEMAAKAAIEAVKDSEFLGTEGARLKGIKATVTMAHFIKSGEWGDTYLYKFLTKDGNVLSWFSTPRGLTKGDEVTIDGTVKEHKEYKGVKETQLTRCKVKGKEGLV